MTISTDLRTQAAADDALLNARLDTIVPALMEHAGIDAWVISAREYAEDPVLATMLPSSWLGTARRRTILVFTERGNRRAAISRYPVGTAFPQAGGPEPDSDQWAALRAHLTEADPASIALNRSSTFPLADGLTATEYSAVHDALGPDLAARIVDADRLAIGWLETRLPAEVDILREACTHAHGILRRALSPEVIGVGVTTTDDVVWWLRQQVHDDGLQSWFQPSVSVQRRGEEIGAIAGHLLPDDPIEPGDLVHIDFGLVFRGLHTDQQQQAYVLREGETSEPESLTLGMRQANRLQDLLIQEMRVGRSGNEALAITRARALEEGIRPTVYTHPIGLHGHAAGATIGLWDQQSGVPGQGDYPIEANTAWSIELCVEIDVAEWAGQRARIMLEEDAFHDGTSVTFLDGRQESLWLI
jgi:Xaa-Pro aminopeptidase